MSSLNWLLVTGLEYLSGAHQEGSRQAAANVETSTSPKVKAAMEMGAKVNLRQAERLKKVFKTLGTVPYERPDPAVQGLSEANNKLLAGTLDPTQRDLINLAFAQTAAHFYMAKYGTLRTYAKRMGKGRAARLLQQTLDEMGETNDRLTRLVMRVMQQKNTGIRREKGGGGAKWALLLGVGAAVAAVAVSNSDETVPKAARVTRKSYGDGLRTTEPGTTGLGTTELRTTELRTTEPGTTGLGTTGTGTTGTGTTGQGTTGPGTTGPGTTGPGTTGPGTTGLGTTGPGTTGPGTTGLGTPKPGTTGTGPTGLGTPKPGTTGTGTTKL